MEPVKVYTVNGTAAGSASSLPDWLTRRRAAKGKGKHTFREHVEGTIDLIQYFEFPEASNRIRTTRDGHHAIATGVYKPQMRVWDLDQLSLKFERHSDAENVDFLILSDDWTKTIHLQTDRTLEVHTQGGFHYRTRIPQFGRSLAYHYTSCDVLVAATGHDVHRLNLDQGRFMVPLDMSSGEVEDVEAVNVANINPAHQLFAFGIEGNGTVQFWDPRSRSRVGILHLPISILSPSEASGAKTLSVTAIASRSDGLTYAFGTSTGHTLLYDIRSPRPYATKDQGYGLPVKCVEWVEGGSRIAGDGMVISADKKVVKIWDRHFTNTNFASVTPSTDINHVHHIPGSGLLMLANEGIRMNAYYIPQLGPAPRWCSFLDNITEEMEDQTGRSVYEDFKFVERSELARLGLDHLVGTPALKPYMHGYFLSLKLYDAARVIANPFVHAEHREKVIKEKIDKLSESRIRTRKDAPKVNKVLAEKIRRDEEREAKKEERRKKHKEKEVATDNAGDNLVAAGKRSLLNDDRFKALFEDPAFEVDTSTREYSLLNPSTVNSKHRRTAVEEEDDESNRVSSDGLGESNSDDSARDSGSEDSEDSSDAGDLAQFDPRARHRQDASNSKPKANRSSPSSRQNINARQPNLVAVRPQTDLNHFSNGRAGKSASFGDRRKELSSRKSFEELATKDENNAIMEMSWMPTTTSKDDHSEGEAPAKSKGKRKGMETFGAGMEKGSNPNGDHGGEESNRTGRSKRRSGVRSGSRNVFRQL
ncbi:WD repeat-containing protein [Ramaria rubella]|nr:WD repeat-containing protein [Ramaria rubella]